MENLFAEAMPQRQEAGAEGAACVVLDVKNAEVLTAASYPTFDLSNYGAELAEKGNDPWVLSWPMATDRVLPSYQVWPTDSVYSRLAITPRRSSRRRRSSPPAPKSSPRASTTTTAPTAPCAGITASLGGSACRPLRR